MSRLGQDRFDDPHLRRHRLLAVAQPSDVDEARRRVDLDDDGLVGRGVEAGDLEVDATVTQAQGVAGPARQVEQAGRRIWWR